jgi:hypothetical protein
MLALGGGGGGAQAASDKANATNTSERTVRVMTSPMNIAAAKRLKARACASALDQASAPMVKTL